MNHLLITEFLVAEPYVAVTETMEEREQHTWGIEDPHTVWRMKKGDIVIDPTRETEKERVGETERGGQAGGRVRVDERDTVAQEDTTVGQTLEADLDPNHLMYEYAYSTVINFSHDESTSQPNLVHLHVLLQVITPNMN